MPILAASLQQSLDLFTSYAIWHRLGSEILFIVFNISLFLNHCSIVSLRVYCSLSEKGGTIRVIAEADRSQSSVRWGLPHRVEALFFVVVSFIAGEFVG